MEGWISLHRKIFENEFYFSERFDKTHAWVDLLLLANHKPQTIFIRGNEVKIGEGELCYSQITLARRWKWNPKSVRKFLTLLVNRKMITFRGGRLTTIVAILNWKKYQKNGEQKSVINGEQNCFDFALFSKENEGIFKADGEQKPQKMANSVPTDNNVNKVIIELAFPLIEKVIQTSSVYSIISKFKNRLGETKLMKILRDLSSKEKRFANENKLAAYLESCTKNNGHIGDALPELTLSEPGYL